MKIQDVKIGGEYFTYVGETRVKVRVTGDGYESRGGQPKTFRCVRVDNGRELPKTRTAAALHTIEDLAAKRISQINERKRLGIVTLPAELPSD